MSGIATQAGMLRGGTGGQIVTSSLVLHLDAGDSNSYSGSGTTWTDLSSTGDDFTLINSPTFSSSNGGEIQFDKNNDKAQIVGSTAIKSMASEGTIQFWFRTLNQTIGAGAWTRLISFSNNLTSNNDYNAYLCVTKSGSVEKSNFWYKGGTPASPNASYPLLNDDNYHNIAYTWRTSGSSMIFNSYLNGVNLKTNTVTQSAYSSTNADVITIAARNNGGNNADCSISVVTMYDAELSASEVQQNFNAHKVRHGI